MRRSCSILPHLALPPLLPASSPPKKHNSAPKKDSSGAKMTNAIGLALLSLGPHSQAGGLQPDSETLPGLCSGLTFPASSLPGGTGIPPPGCHRRRRSACAWVQTPQRRRLASTVAYSRWKSGYDCLLIMLSVFTQNSKGGKCPPDSGGTSLAELVYCYDLLH